VSLIPAWGDAFVPERLQPAPPTAYQGPVDRAWAYGDERGTGVKVAIVDSGVDGDHPAVGGVAGGVVIEPDPDAPSGVRVIEGPHGDLGGHGTACAAIVRELAPDVELFSVRVLGAKLTGRAYVFAEGLQWCIDNGMDVVNLSLTTPNDDWYGDFHELCDAAAFQRIVLVAAMNNLPQTCDPSQFSSVLSVAATTGRDREVFFCNPDPPAEWGAPGIDVPVAWANGSTITTTGNSFATPVIAGHVARILGTHPGLTPWQVRTLLAALAANSQS
jgi:subtilisin family serine protease